MEAGKPERSLGSVSLLFPMKDHYTLLHEDQLMMKILPQMLNSLKQSLIMVFSILVSIMLLSMFMNKPKIISTHGMVKYSLLVILMELPFHKS